MDSRLQPRFPFRFRQDLLITRQQEKGTGKYSYLIEDPVSSESYSFGEEEYFLCQAMDGTASADGADLVVSLGGDGTLLRSVETALHKLTELKFATPAMAIWSTRGRRRSIKTSAASTQRSCATE